MKICVVGAGAIGGLLGIRLAHLGHEVSLVARGAHLAAMRAKGARLVTRGQPDITVHPALADDPSAFGPQDLVVLAVKAPALPSVAPRLAPLIGPGTHVVTAMNGIPWWFGEGLEGPLAERRLESVDPDGALAAAAPAGRNIGCVVHAAASVPEPGVIDNPSGDLFIVGTPNPAATPVAATLAQAITASGLSGRLTDDIHGEIWLKLIGNMGMSPISVLTLATLAGMGRDADLRSVSVAMMDEALAVGETFGLSMEMSADARVDLGAELGEIKTSMLQDLERGRPMEIDAILGVVAEMGRIAGRPTPTIDTVLALLRGRARVAGLY